VQCEACHDHRSNAATGLADFRTRGDAVGVDDQSGLCFQCHSIGSTETASIGSPPFAWNGRDVSAEFARTSHHPLTASKGATTTRSVTCASCHDVHGVTKGGSAAWDTSRVSDPLGATRVYSTLPGATMTDFCLTCHSSTSVTSGFRIPYTVNFSAQFSAPFFVGWSQAETSTAFKQSGHYTTTGTKALCQTCHDPHGSDNVDLAAWTRPAGFSAGTPGVRDNTSFSAFEENLCLQCHGNGSDGHQAPGAQDVATPLSKTHHHPVEEVSFAHRDNETTADVGAANRHSECTDCHNPHASQPGTHAQGTSVGGALRGASGVKPVWSSNPGEAATSYSSVVLTGGAGDAEAYVCFKCHSSVTELPTSGGTNGLGASDLSREFNPNNAGYHNVLGSAGAGVRTSFTDASGTVTVQFWNNLNSPWTSNSAMACSDCHTNESVGSAKGPHGSSQPFMLDPAYSGAWETATLAVSSSGRPVPGNLICTKCHDMTSAAPAHQASGHAGEKCIACHVRIPHGWVRPRLLGYTTGPLQYRSEKLVGVMRDPAHVSWTDSMICAADCHTASHPATDVAGSGYWK
jgi:hypothetical protein